MIKKLNRALLSVTNKEGLVHFAAELEKHGVEIISTGGTAKLLEKSDIEVVQASVFTGMPEILDGRVKTLHPKIYGGILADRDKETHLWEMRDNNIVPIDMVVCNLYDFESAILEGGLTVEEAIEKIDIGGPTMIRAAAKNFQNVTVVCDPADYEMLMDEMGELDGGICLETRLRLMRKAFWLTREYDDKIYHFFRDHVLVTDEDKVVHGIVEP